MLRKYESTAWKTRARYHSLRRNSYISFKTMNEPFWAPDGQICSSPFTPVKRVKVQEQPRTTCCLLSCKSSSRTTLQSLASLLKELFNLASLFSHCPISFEQRISDRLLSSSDHETVASLKHPCHNPTRNQSLPLLLVLALLLQSTNLSSRVFEHRDDGVLCGNGRQFSGRSLPASLEKATADPVIGTSQRRSGRQRPPSPLHTPANHHRLRSQSPLRVPKLQAFAPPLLLRIPVSLRPVGTANFLEYRSSHEQGMK
jgi:hypothetical protein